MVMNCYRDGVHGVGLHSNAEIQIVKIGKYVCHLYVDLRTLRELPYLDLSEAEAIVSTSGPHEHLSKP